MGNFPWRFVQLIFLAFLFLFVLNSKTYAASISVTGKASVLNTADTYLDFSNYNSNAKIDNSTGNFSGYAFLEDVGWVAFGSTDNTEGPVNVNLTSGAVSGKAKALNTSKYIDFTNYNSNVTVNTSTGVFSGYAFSEDVGWLNFADTGVNTGGTALTTSSSSSSSSSNSNSTSSSPSAPTCGNQTPASAPSLYSAIAEDGDSITLYFTDAQNPVDHYTLSYGLKELGTFQWGQDNIGGQGAGKYTVNGLSPGTTYQFRVRPGNGCATGDWSNTISATTKGIVSFNQLEITRSELVPVKDEPQEETKDKETAKKESEKPPLKTYAISVKVVDEKGSPVEGAKVTIHSDVKEAVTDKDGIARFADVDEGEHKVLISYNGFSGEQSLNLQGDVKEFALSMTIKPEALVLSQAAWVVIGVLVIVIFALVAYIFRLKRRSK